MPSSFPSDGIGSFHGGGGVMLTPTMMVARPHASSSISYDGGQIYSRGGRIEPPVGRSRNPGGPASSCGNALWMGSPKFLYGFSLFFLFLFDLQRRASNCFRKDPI